MVRLLQPTLQYGSRGKTLELVTSAPERPVQLLLLKVGAYCMVLAWHLMYALIVWCWPGT